jgi:hypothetical protein
LLSGVVEGLQRNGWHDVPVLAVETDGAASLHAAMAAGHTVELSGIQSVATSLGAKRVAEQALACSRTHTVHSHLVSDREALQACERLLRDHRVLVEPPAVRRWRCCSGQRYCRPTAMCWSSSAVARPPHWSRSAPGWNSWPRPCSRVQADGRPTEYRYILFNIAIQKSCLSHVQYP